MLKSEVYNSIQYLKRKYNAINFNSRCYLQKLSRKRCSIELCLFDFNVNDVVSYSLDKLSEGRRNREQIRANTTSRVTHGDSRSCRFESSWLSRYRRYRISRIRFNGHLVFKPEKKNCRRTNGRVDR